jgi:hypothetical protein
MTASEADDVISELGTAGVDLRMGWPQPVRYGPPSRERCIDSARLMAIAAAVSIPFANRNPK